ncbi:MAG: type II toxin-antitoxin system YafQ family toxin [Alphaproteobacteria bacterium]|nr:type II toxin-antitoxin system YafQ family toxin [Alphaproteobacteria bacterium]
MMRPIQTTRRFERNLQATKKRGKNLDKIWQVVESLGKGEPLANRHRPHRLSGIWSPCWECHIEPDWLLIWLDTEEALVLVATGTHSELFG